RICPRTAFVIEMVHLDSVARVSFCAIMQPPTVPLVKALIMYCSCQGLLCLLLTCAARTVPCSDTVMGAIRARIGHCFEQSSRGMCSLQIALATALIDFTLAMRINAIANKQLGNDFIEMLPIEY